MLLMSRRSLHHAEHLQSDLEKVWLWHSYMKDISGVYMYILCIKYISGLTIVYY